MFKRLFSRKAAPEPVAPPTRSLAAGERIYAIGDIHGRLDLLDTLLAMIARDDAARGKARTRLVFLGDLPDRGPDSRGVIERLMALRETKDCIFLMGNHEEIVTRVWEGERQMASTFNRAGGRATLMSYGLSGEEYDACTLDEMVNHAARIIPKAHIDFLRSFRPWYQSGDYLFVHAGIMPGLHIEDQDEVDLRWIRDRFTNSQEDHGALVIHGHSITDAVDERPNRIGIDTGAYASGILTALALEGEERWLLQTGSSAD